MRVESTMESKMGKGTSPVGKPFTRSPQVPCIAFSVKNSGSFIRPSPNVSYGQSFLEALTSKYIETPHGSISQESVILGSSQGSIVVEAVNLDKIRSKLADLGTLREVSLVNLDVATGDADGVIQQTCPSKLYLKNTCNVHHSVSDIRGLDLSKNLIPDWDVVALITRELPLLKRLCLKLALSLELVLFLKRNT